MKKIHAVNMYISFVLQSTCCIEVIFFILDCNISASANGFCNLGQQESIYVKKIDLF